MHAMVLVGSYTTCECMAESALLRPWHAYYYQLSQLSQECAKKTGLQTHDPHVDIIPYSFKKITNNVHTAKLSTVQGSSMIFATKKFLVVTAKMKVDGYTSAIRK